LEVKLLSQKFYNNVIQINYRRLPEHTRQQHIPGSLKRGLRVNDAEWHPLEPVRSPVTVAVDFGAIRCPSVVFKIIWYDAMFRNSI
jgi:hypothetical protein